MLCYEIWVDEKRLCIAGHKDAVSLQASIFATKGTDRPSMVVSAIIKSGDKASEDARWAKTSLSIGSDVKIRVVDSLKPDVPETLAVFGARLHPNGTSELFCSFCGRSENEDQPIIQGETANICLECAETASDALRDKRGSLE